MKLGAPRSGDRKLYRPKVSIDHFAFLRGWCQGLGERDLWSRYLARLGEFDQRRCRSFIRELQTELGAVARRSGRPDLAGLLRRHAMSITAVADLAEPNSPAPPATVQTPNVDALMPSIDDYRARFDEDMFSESELIEMWEEERAQLKKELDAKAAANHDAGTSVALVRPASRALERRSRLIQRQLETLDWLERLACEMPQPGDPIEAWLDIKVCERLATQGILTLEQLMFFVRKNGYRWYKKVPKVGEKGAALIVSWLKNQEGTLGALPVQCTVPAEQLKSIVGSVQTLAGPAQVGVIAPLERLQVPSSLATAQPGIQGSNRAPLESCKLSASNDFEAIHEWLALRPEGTNTWRAYRREAERFLLWSIFERRKPLSGLSSLDCAAYRDFLAAPGPDWKAPRNALRWSPEWRPFEGPLKPRSAATAVTILTAMCEWLARRKYLDSNPWDGVPKSVRPPEMPRSRSLSRHQWRKVEEWLTALPSSPSHERLRLIFGFAYRSGLRVSELAAAKVEWLRHEQLEDGAWAWSIMVLGKRNKWREVALPSSAVAIISRSFELRGLSTDLLSNPPDTPLISSLATGGDEGPNQAPLTAGRIYEVTKDAFRRCAIELYANDRASSEKLLTASTHWLRHTYGTHAAEKMPITVLQAQLGHASPATTSIYTNAERKTRQKAVDSAFD